MSWLTDSLHDFITIWIVVDPISILPAFLALTPSADEVTRKLIALEGALAAFVVLMICVATGQIVLSALGISLQILEISGGLILFLFAAQRVVGRDTLCYTASTHQLPPFQRAIFPIAVPNIAGPGAILTVILRTDNSRFDLVEQLRTSGAVALVVTGAFFLMIFAVPIVRFIGAGTSNVLRRVTGMIIAAYAVNLVLEGLARWLHLPVLGQP